MTCSVREAERNSSPNIASSVISNTPSTTTERGRDPDILHNVLMAVLLAPQAKVGEETVGHLIAAIQKKDEKDRILRTSYECHCIDILLK